MDQRELFCPILIKTIKEVLGIISEDINNRTDICFLEIT